MSELVHYSSQDECQHCLHLFECEESTNETPIILMFPAMGVRAPYYFKLAHEFNLLNIHFACTDLRGHGPMHHKPSWQVNYGYKEMLLLDWPAAIKKVKERYPNNPIYLMGHSLGAQLSVCYASLNPNDINGIIMIASGSIHHKAFHHKWRVLMATQFQSLLSQIIGFLPGRCLKLDGREARQVIKDWAYTARTGRYRIKQNKGYRTLDGHLTQLKKPVFAMSFDGDKFAPHSSMVKLLDKLSCAPKQHIRTSSLEMQTSNLGHFSWVQHAHVIVPKIANWMQQHCD